MPTCGRIHDDVTAVAPSPVGPFAPAARALRVGALCGIGFLLASVGWDALVAPELVGELLAWRGAGVVVLVVCGSLTYAWPQRATWLGAAMAGGAAAAIGVAAALLPWGIAYGIGGLMLLALGIGFVALDVRTAAASASAVVACGGLALWLAGAREDSMLATAFFLLPALTCAVAVAQVTSARVGRNRDVRAELLTLREDLARFGRNDELTGVHDERQLHALGRREIAFARRRKSALSAIKIDVEHLARITELHGRTAADETLRAVASMVQATLRETDLLARLRTGEFAAVLPDADAAGAEVLCERLKKSLERASILAQGKIVEVTVSVGAATLHDGDQDVEDLLKRANDALRAKKSAAAVAG